MLMVISHDEMVLLEEHNISTIVLSQLIACEYILERWEPHRNGGYRPAYRFNKDIDGWEPISRSSLSR